MRALQSFSRHLLQLMTSWAVVCDVWYLEPQEKLPEESPEQFAERVQEMICKKAGISKVPWDGMLKYYRPRPTLTEKRRKVKPHFPAVVCYRACLTYQISGIMRRPLYNRWIECTGWCFCVGVCAFFCL